MLKQVKEKKCKECGNGFKPSLSTQQVCSLQCALSRSHSKNKIDRQKQERKSLREQKEKLKTPSQRLKPLEAEVNSIVRIIDYGKKCISCGRLKKAFAGHFHSVGANSSLRFNLHNEHVQCFSCNGKKGGNQFLYAVGLEKRYGSAYREYVQYEIVRTAPRIELSAEETRTLIGKCRQIKKSLQEERIYTNEERIDLRNNINSQLGIYTNNFNY